MGEVLRVVACLFPTISSAVASASTRTLRACLSFYLEPVHIGFSQFEERGSPRPTITTQQRLPCNPTAEDVGGRRPSGRGVSDPIGPDDVDDGLHGPARGPFRKAATAPSAPNHPQHPSAQVLLRLIMK
ncbi:hypothetical protein F5144DRAFT_223523 [Chaetomium tenue]|uniref:Uncharacterized protein n=1 Tax=Chaetomium tenue TaxID=1854479 RepID=A0ACB7P800_9PEZI|nr:hypothetical protein F5144DRAFT_223523 [Chaetomium globosum]